MKHNEQQEIELFKFIDKVKEKGQNAMNRWQSAEELQEEIAKMCLLCMRTPEDPQNCEICNWVQRTAENQILMNFEKIDWDGDND
jgi:hypothetical protein